MFWPDVLELQGFYASAIGRLARRAICRRIAEIWEPAEGASVQQILGLGYAAPYISCTIPKQAGEHRVALLMPSRQGAVHWPPQAKNRSLLGSELHIPFADGAVDRMVVAHLLEFADPLATMAEINRVLAPGGQALLIVPNRMGLWSQSDATPFGYGRPFSLRQSQGLLGQTELHLLMSVKALYFPPSEKRWVLKITGVLEAFGRRFLPLLGGIKLLVVEKRVPAPIQEKIAAKPMLEGAIAPA